MDWFRNLSIRWKFQLAFFVVTMVTTIFNRWLGSYELEKMIDIARVGGASAEVITRLAEDRMRISTTLSGNPGLSLPCSLW